ncbi:MAG: PilZ domain-containing protein [Armatimonadetes bacterium]|nr:PilZ domain-containing protein [Armatimonadota bacterium]
MNERGTERRRYRRADVDMPIVYMAHRNPSCKTGRLLDIGAGGARLSVSDAPAIGDRIQFRLSRLEQNAASAWGHIAWTTESSQEMQIGVRFSSCNPALVRHLLAG